ncbi:GNAT family N-acetyltransferase [Neptunicella marina]|uniref:GNAT family N-acetyltransferase n=1 Tax=Neptunicella marina TaxID=2125989 RepID=A0A8J6IV72_9ALTE|nr:GNAT family N-acetyltransferase [Neptunicella marina]MBC3766211.1 GNAT family N-acetyltransferase [Neptunicella marina]
MYQLKQQPPTVEQFASLRDAVGWTNPKESVLQSSVDNSLFWVCIFEQETLVATGRVIGDGAMYFYIQDVIVHPAHQQQGLGKQIMQCIEHYLSQTTVTGCTVGLLAAQGKEKFYKRFAYVERDGNMLGLGMCRFI